MHVGQDDQLVVAAQETQAVGAVRKGRPLWHGVSEVASRSPVGFETESLGDAAVDPRQQLRVGQIGRGLLVSALLPGEGSEGRVASEVRPGIVQDQRLQGVPDPDFPVDQGAVAVEGEGTEVDQSRHEFMFGST